MYSMNGHNKSKINQMLLLWPKGTVAVYPLFLNKLKITRQLVSAYQQSGWIKSIGRGAFIRVDGDKVEWTGGLYTLQKYMDLSVHVGGKSALEFLGYAHYIRLNGNPSVWLFGNSTEKLPAWFIHNKWGAKIHYCMTNLFGGSISEGLTSKEVNGSELVISSPDRAIFEYLYLVPDDASFEEAKQIMEGLATLRPKIVQKLLEQCRSVKVKRLFMFLAEHCKHTWVKSLDLSKVNMGKGKRVIAKGGYLDSKYNITVPLSLKNEK